MLFLCSDYAFSQSKNGIKIDHVINKKGYWWQIDCLVKSSLINSIFTTEDSVEGKQIDTFYNDHRLKHDNSCEWILRVMNKAVHKYNISHTDTPFYTLNYSFQVKQGDKKDRLQKEIIDGYIIIKENRIHFLHIDLSPNCKPVKLKTCVKEIEDALLEFRP